MPKRDDDGGVELIALFVRQVSALVSATADELANVDRDWNVLQWEAHLYRTLEINCAEKARLAKEFVGLANRGGQ